MSTAIKMSKIEQDRSGNDWLRTSFKKQATAYTLTEEPCLLEIADDIHAEIELMTRSQIDEDFIALDIVERVLTQGWQNFCANIAEIADCTKDPAHLNRVAREIEAFGKRDGSAHIQAPGGQEAYDIYCEDAAYFNEATRYLGTMLQTCANKEELANMHIAMMKDTDKKTGISLLQSSWQDANSCGEFDGFQVGKTVYLPAQWVRNNSAKPS